MGKILYQLQTRYKSCKLANAAACWTRFLSTNGARDEISYWSEIQHRERRARKKKLNLVILADCGMVWVIKGSNSIIIFPRRLTAKLALEHALNEHSLRQSIHAEILVP